MAEKSEKETGWSPMRAEVLERLRAIQTHRLRMAVESPEVHQVTEYVKRVREMYGGSQAISDFTSHFLRLLNQLPVTVSHLDRKPEDIFACAPTPMEESTASEKLPDEDFERVLAGISLEMIVDAATRLTEEVEAYRQTRAQLEEVDAIIERLERDREEIDRLKEETRSNISELQRMIAA